MTTWRLLNEKCRLRPTKIGHSCSGCWIQYPFEWTLLVWLGWGISDHLRNLSAVPVGFGLSTSPPYTWSWEKARRFLAYSFGTFAAMTFPMSQSYNFLIFFIVLNSVSSSIGLSVCSALLRDGSCTRVSVSVHNQWQRWIDVEKTSLKDLNALHRNPLIY